MAHVDFTYSEFSVFKFIVVYFFSSKKSWKISCCMRGQILCTIPATRARVFAHIYFALLKRKKNQSAIFIPIAKNNKTFAVNLEYYRWYHRTCNSVLIIITYLMTSELFFYPWIVKYFTNCLHWNKSERYSGRLEKSKIEPFTKIHAFFISKTLISKARLKLAKNYAKAKQHSEAKLLQLENYSLFSSMLSSKNRRYYKKCIKNKYVYSNEIIRLMKMKMRLKMKNRSYRCD